jgi:hypothetical protein
MPSDDWQVVEEPELVPVLTIRPKDCTNHCDDGPCDCSGEWQVQGYTSESVDALIARLREREAQLARERERLAEYEEQWNELAGVEFIEYWHTIGYSCSAGTAIKALLARVAEAEQIIHSALVTGSDPRKALSETPETPCSICGSYGHFTHNHGPVAHKEENQ